ncbi:MAG: response regulator transcription factor [Marinospirillum sp.]|uniref:response regulator transcription factor n=1 Tax=Marinospirillum sp. TaxID=2183934 RepID=UPI0019E2F79E|nr:response regulator transcription factor [Marinospirillum sp.]MBE0507920.1 response regulator transcription factor [Marinospirillum sp.]
MYLLLVEDDQRLARLLIHLIKEAGHTLDHADNGQLARSYLRNSHYDLLLLDWMLPEVSGIELCKEARSAGFKGGILMLTARDALEDRLEGFAKGADDYLTKPFETEELLARIEALGRRIHQPLQDQQLEVPPWTLNCNNRQLKHLNGQSVELTQREFQLLELLMRRAGQGVAREVIFDRVWGRDQAVTDNVLDATLKLLRKKLEQAAPAEQPIQTLRGLGYSFDQQ